MIDSKRLPQLIKSDVERVELTMKADILALAGDIDDLLFEILQYGLFGGGKRFRPLLAVIASRICDGKQENVYDLAISFEYLHLATLFHDDVIDRADLRRGKPSVAKAFGIESAILAGDFLHARSMAIVGKFGGAKALDIFCHATARMVDGEFLQLRNAKNYNQSEEDYYRAVRGKTALLISATTEIGGLYGGADSRQQHALKEYGSNLGYGFQIVDDLLDYQGDAKKTGKSVGNDLAEGKMTLPLILAVAQAESNDKSLLQKILSDALTRKNEFEQVYAIIEKYDCFSLARNRAEHCIAKAIRQLDVFPDEKKAEKEILSALAEYVLVREK